MLTLRNNALLVILSIILLISVMACSTPENIISNAERHHQNKIDEIVSTTLFDRELDNNASYKIRNDGMVVIKFDESIKENVYTEVVTALRANKHITMLRAEQAGVEICSLP